MIVGGLETCTFKEMNFTKEKRVETYNFKMVGKF